MLIIIGGINGPLHNAVVAVLTPLNKKNGGIILTQVSIKLSILLLILAMVKIKMDSSGMNCKFLENLASPAPNVVGQLLRNS